MKWRQLLPDEIVQTYDQFNLEGSDIQGPTMVTYSDGGWSVCWDSVGKPAGYLIRFGGIIRREIKEDKIVL